MLGRVQGLRCAPPLPGAFGALDPACARQASGRVSSEAGPRRQTARRGIGSSRDSARCTRRRSPARRGRARRRVRSAASPCVCSSAWSRSTSRIHVRGPPMGELGEIGQRRGAEIEQVLPLQIAPRAFARDGGDALRAMLGQDRAVARLECRAWSALKRPATIRTRSR